MHNNKEYFNLKFNILYFFILFCSLILTPYIKLFADELNNMYLQPTWLNNKQNYSIINKEVLNNEKMPKWLYNTSPINTQDKIDFSSKLKKHFLDIDLYKQRMQDSQTNYQNFMKVLEHEGTYFVYTYSLPPFGIYGHNILHELKFQISFKVPIWRGAFWSKGAVFFGYTQTMWFQQFNSRYSNPVRDTNYKPYIFYSYPANWKFLGGKIKELRIGFLHFSNGVGGDECERDSNGIIPSNCKSRSASNRIMFEGIWEFNNFGVHISAWPYIPFRRDNPDLIKYMGYANIRLYYNYKKHFAELYVSPIITNYAKYYGSVQFGYAYRISPFFALYGQYFYGYGDSLYEYNIPAHRIGIGIRAIGF